MTIEKILKISDQLVKKIISNYVKSPALALKIELEQLTEKIRRGTA